MSPAPMGQGSVAFCTPPCLRYGAFFAAALRGAAFFAAGFFAAGFFAAFLAVLAISQTPSEPCKKQFRVRIIAEFSGKRKLKLKLCPA